MEVVRAAGGAPRVRLSPRAQGELEKAEEDKGGHRVNALNLTNQAISEVRAGIAYAN